MPTTNRYFYALGRRKQSTARVRMQSGKGNFVINDLEADKYLDQSKYLLSKLYKPFAVLEVENKKYDVSVKVSGGGKNAQTEAIRLGLAKIFALMNDDLKATLKRADLLGRDPREKERKKFGLKGARKKRQFTKR